MTTRSVYEDKIDETWSRHYAAQAKTKDVKKFLAPKRKIVEAETKRRRIQQRRRKAGSHKDLMKDLRRLQQ